MALCIPHPPTPRACLGAVDFEDAVSIVYSKFGFVIVRIHCEGTSNTVVFVFSISGQGLSLHPPNSYCVRPPLSSTSTEYPAEASRPATTEPVDPDCECVWVSVCVVNVRFDIYVKRELRVIETQLLNRSNHKKKGHIMSSILIVEWCTHIFQREVIRLKVSIAIICFIS